MFRSRRLRRKSEQLALPCADLHDYTWCRLVFQLPLYFTSAEKSWPPVPVTKIRIPSHGDWKENVLCTDMAQFLFSFQLLANKLLSAPLHKTWVTLTEIQRLSLKCSEMLWPRGNGSAAVQATHEAIPPPLPSSSA